MKNKEYKKAEIELRNVLQIDPLNEDAYIKLSEIYRILAKPEKEIKVLLQVTSLNPDNLEAQHKLCQVFLLGKQTKQARETAQFILAKDPNSIRAYHMLATVQVQERNVDAAIKTLNKAIVLSPDNPHLYLFLGYVQYYNNRDFPSAEASYLKAISIDDTILESYQELANIYVNEKKIDKAEALLINLTKTSKNRVGNLAVLADFYEMQNMLKKAENTHKTIINESDPKDYKPVFNLALFFARHRNFEEAVEYFNQALAIDNILKIREKLATAYFDLDRYKDAREQADLILKTQPNNAVARLVLAQLLMVDKKYAAALEMLEQVIVVDNKNVTAYYLKAACLLEKDLKKLPAQQIRMAAAGNVSAEDWKRDLAVESLKTAINLSPEHFMARLMLADIYIQTNQLSLADQQIASVLELSENNFIASLMLGDVKILQKDWRSAETIFKEIIEKAPTYSWAYIKLGTVYDAQKKSKQALAEFKKALDIDPLNMDAMRNIINAYMSHGQKEDAVKILDAHSRHPKLTSYEKGYIEFLLGKIALSQNLLPQAKEHFNQSIQINNKTTPSYEALAKISEVNGDKPMAINYYEAILAYNPEYIPAHMNLARIYKSERNMEKTKESLEKVLEIKDDHATAANEMAYILADEGKDLQKALHLARIAESQVPNNPNILDTLGWIYYKQKSYELAITKLLDSLNINPDNPVTNYHLGWAYYDTGRYEKAREYMRIALKLNPNFEGAEKARNLIGG
ncbi:tetratricopeptide repeat protein [Desulfobacter curvatus]|uniref:tetratricopeptide repeat protein n=1 Tax=Desulfobacter curvatus TaxID=2290 RepID=UPI001469C74A|nr:tetratricopeptide repeat protein [Desulfobacter curvatus]